jgi:3-phenylpropionate/trans-cinnamate dioxygenase ferredoxin reductase subunit
MDQANIAAASMLDIDEKYNKVPWFWSDQADLKLQIAGLSQGYDAVITRGDMSASKFSLLYYRGAQLISIQSVNSPADYLSVRKMLTAGKNLPMEAARDLSVPLKTHAN